jgi:hypothetical protein
MATPQVFAHGRDPYFEDWPDTVQLDDRRPETRRAMSDLLLSIADRCDGIHCDMAMLLTREVFLRTSPLTHRKPSSGPRPSPI